MSQTKFQTPGKSENCLYLLNTRLVGFVFSYAIYHCFGIKTYINGTYHWLILPLAVNNVISLLEHHSIFSCWENTKIKVLYARRTNVNIFFTEFDLRMVQFTFAISRYHYATQNYPNQY